MNDWVHVHTPVLLQIVNESHLFDHVLNVRSLMGKYTNYTRNGSVQN